MDTEQGTAPLPEQTDQLPESHQQAQDETVALYQSLQTDLAAREAALEVKERHFQAREHILALGLPPSTLDLVDLHSEESMQQSLKLAAAALAAAPKLPPVPPVPRDAAPPAPSFASYIDRAQLFQTDPAAYQQMVSQEGQP